MSPKEIQEAMRRADELDVPEDMKDPLFFQRITDMDRAYFEEEERRFRKYEMKLAED